MMFFFPLLQTCIAPTYIMLLLFLSFIVSGRHDGGTAIYEKYPFVGLYTLPLLIYLASDATNAVNSR